MRSQGHRWQAISTVPATTGVVQMRHLCLLCNSTRAGAGTGYACGLDTVQQEQYHANTVPTPKPQTLASPQTHVSPGPGERLVLSLSVALYEGNDRYRPGVDRRRYGVAYQLQVRPVVGAEPVWSDHVRWYRTRAEAGAVMAESKAGHGWLGQQLAQHTARDLRLVCKS